MVTSVENSTVGHVRTLNLIDPKTQQVRSCLLENLADDKGEASSFHLLIWVLWATNTLLKFDRVG